MRSTATSNAASPVQRSVAPTAIARAWRETLYMAVAVSGNGARLRGEIRGHAACRSLPRSRKLGPAAAADGVQWARARARESRVEQRTTGGEVDTLS